MISLIGALCGWACRVLRVLNVRHHAALPWTLLSPSQQQPHIHRLSIKYLLEPNSHKVELGSLIRLTGGREE